MSCETRHRAIIANLLTLAGLTDTVDADTVIRSGSGRRRQRGDPHGPESHLPPLHDEMRIAMGITGHGADTLPAWGPALIALLVSECGRTNRRACLTLRLLTGGWNAVTPLLTDHDRDWLLTAAAIGLPLPAAWATRLTIRPAAVPIAWTLPDPLRRAVGLVTVLDALFGIDAVPPAAVQTVTPRQVLQLAIGIGAPFASYTALQTVLRAVLEDTPAAQVLRLVSGGIGAVFRLTTITPSFGTRPAAWTEQGIALVLADAAATLRAVGGPALDPTTLRAPSPTVIAAICSTIAKRPKSADNLAPVLAALMQLWRMEGREDAVTATIRRLETILTRHRSSPNVVRTVATLLAAGVVVPPHGDAFLAQIGTLDYNDNTPNYTPPIDAWSAMASAAVYVAACQRHGHRPTVAGLDDLVRTRWRTITSTVAPSPIPLLAVGQERELLLPLIHAERDRTRRVAMLLDCIDAMAMLAGVGGDTDGFRAVLRDVVTSDCDSLDPQVVVRLVADRNGQTVLPRLSSVSTIPAWKEVTDDRYHRLIPHLVSPAWETAPPHLRTWWGGALRDVTASMVVASALAKPHPLYSTVAPEVAMVYPTKHIVTRAVAHPAWATFPETERRAWLAQALCKDSGDNVLAIVARAATPAAMADIRATLPHVGGYHPNTVHALQALIDDDLRRTP